MSSHIRSMAWVAEHLQDPSVRIVDCRFILGQPQAGQQAYAEGHLPGAIYLDLERDLSGPIQAHGGRHPLPDMMEFAGKMGAAGISRETTVVAYDDQGGAMASRLWWMLRYAGHEQAAIMDSGFTAWRQAGYPVTADVPSVQPARFEAQLQPGMLLSMDDVRARLGQPGVVLLDSREEKRYLGLEEPIDRVAGHIPGAHNVFWKLSLQPDGSWSPADDLGQRFATLLPDRSAEVVVYCGSGVTACPNILALTEAGYPNIKLYAGSWSDWISYEENQVATGEEGKEYISV